MVDTATVHDVRRMIELCGLAGAVGLCEDVIPDRNVRVTVGCVHMELATACRMIDGRTSSGGSG